MAKERGMGTKAIHSDFNLDDNYGALNTPIYQNSTYKFENCKQGGDRFAGEQEGYIYTRLGNPTTSVAESRVALLEGAEAGVAFSSGMGAISTVFWTFLRSGAHIIADKTLYGCTFALLEHGAPRYGIEVSLVDLSDLEQLKAALKENTVMVYFETPANPNLKIVDIKAVSDIAKNYNKDIRIVCDNTFATPYIQRPLSFGCDIVVHSATKYLNGHGDVIAGFAVGNAEDMAEVKSFGLKDMTGAVQSPNDSFLIIRGLKTFDIRMERHCENGEKLAAYLASNPLVEKVYYPGLESHANYNVAKKQMDRFGGMVSFELKGGYESGVKLLDNLEMIALAVSLGDAETLAEHPASMTHATYSPEERKLSGIPEGLVRVSAGLENHQDIIADFESSFAKL